MTIIMKRTKNILTVMVIELTCEIISTGRLLSSLMKMLLLNAMLMLWLLLLVSKNKWKSYSTISYSYFYSSFLKLLVYAMLDFLVDKLYSYF